MLKHPESSTKAEYKQKNMKFKINPPLLKLWRIKKYIYLINDITNIMLKKERAHTEENAKKLRVALIIVSIILVLSLIANIYYVIS